MRPSGERFSVLLWVKFALGRFGELWEEMQEWRTLGLIQMKLSPDFTYALTYAAELHNGQNRKGTNIPYVAHLLIVAGLVLEYGGTEDEAIAALLHDAVEDQGGRATLDRIRRRFGMKVANIVESCSDTDVEPKPEWRERKEQYLAHLKQASDSVKLVSAADKLHNATAILRDYRDIGERIWDRFKGGREGTIWNLRALVAAYGTVENQDIVRDLDRVVTELEQEIAKRPAVQTEQHRDPLATERSSAAVSEVPGFVHGKFDIKAARAHLRTLSDPVQQVAYAELIGFENSTLIMREELVESLNAGVMREHGG
jgi:hypothetical protein